jgi:exosortase
MTPVTPPADATPVRTWAWLREVPSVTVPLGLAVIAFSAHLWPEWTSNPDLSHGIFAPLVFVLLLLEGVRAGTRRWLAPNALLTAGIATAAILAVALFVVAGLLAASLQWSHSLVQFVLASTLVSLLAAGLLCLASARVRCVPVNWTTVTAIGLWMLVSPLPEGTYARLTFALQGMVTAGVMDALHVLGIPAQRLGNIIELPNTSVGVEEACSGIRSLLSCMYAGFLFAAWMVRGTARRLLLVALAPLLAIAMNFLRSLALTLMANAGVDIAGFWHDATGFAILGVTAVLLAALAHVLGRKAATARPQSEAGPTRARHDGALSARARGRLMVAASAAVIAALAIFFVTYRASVPEVREDPPDIMALLPAGHDGWQTATARNLYRFSDVLRTTHLGERTYFREVNGEVQQITVYISHWPSGTAPVSLVASHTPDACWPGTGWVAQPDRYRNALLELGDQQLPVAEQRFFMNGQYPQYVWFWHIYDGRVLNYRDPYSVPALLELALKYGFRRQGSQYFVRISSNQPWEKFSNEPLIQTLVARLAPLGLAPH